MKAVYGLYPDADLAQSAVDRLKSAGFAEEQITILSCEPLEDYPFWEVDRGGLKPTLMPWFSGLGGLLGLTTGYFLTSVTQKLWPINTGGMPIVTNWSNMIIIFELTMLGAVFATVITLLAAARIPGRIPELYDPEISSGNILVGIANPKDAVLVEHTLRELGGGRLKTIG